MFHWVFFKRLVIDCLVFWLKLCGDAGLIWLKKPHKNLIARSAAKIGATQSITVFVEYASSFSLPVEIDFKILPACRICYITIRFFSTSSRGPLLLSSSSALRNATEHGTGMGLSCSVLKRRYRDLLRAADPALHFAHLSGARAVIEQRMHARLDHYMPPWLLASQMYDLDPLQPDEAGIFLDIGFTPARQIAQILAGEASSAASSATSSAASSATSSAASSATSSAASAR